jgi:hypothetical protein
VVIAAVPPTRRRAGTGPPRALDHGGRDGRAPDSTGGDRDAKMNVM